MWIIKSKGKQKGPLEPLIHPETGFEIKKTKYVSVPYFPGLSESFKKIFRYTHIQICFKGVNTLRSLLMHPKDEIPVNIHKDVVYKWSCKSEDCNAAYIGETCRPLEDRVKEHIKSGRNSAIHAHCSRNNHPLPTVDDFVIIDKEPNQVRREAKEAIHIRRLDPNLNRNVGKMVIPHSFDVLLGAKPQHNRVFALSQSQLDPANLLEMRPHTQIPPPSSRFCRATNFNVSSLGPLLTLSALLVTH